MGAALLGIGAGMGLGGAFLGGKAARQRKNQLNDIANMPGLNTTSIGAEALAGMESNFGAASELTKKINDFNIAERSDFLTGAIPGYEDRKAATLGITDSFLRGEIPQDVQDAIWDSAAGRAIAGGFSGSEFGRNLTAKDFGLTSLGLMQSGLDRTSQINRDTASLEGPELVSVARNLGITPQELVSLRSGERSEKLRMLTGAAVAPGNKDVWAKYLTDTGSSMMGLGLGDIMGK